MPDTLGNTQMLVGDFYSYVSNSIADAMKNFETKYGDTYTLGNIQITAKAILKPIPYNGKRVVVVDLDESAKITDGFASEIPIKINKVTS